MYKLMMAGVGKTFAEILDNRYTGFACITVAD